MARQAGAGLAALGVGVWLLAVLTGSGRLTVARLTRAGLAVLGLRTGETSLIVLVLLGGVAVLVRLAVLDGLTGLYGPTVGGVDRRLAHKHLPQR